MAVDNFIPELWSAQLLAHLDKVHVFANLVNRDYEGEIRAYGDTVHINQIGDITIGNYAGTLGDPEELAGTEKTLVIDQAKYFNFMIDDVDNAQTNPKLMGPAMERASYAMNDAVDQYLAGLIIDNGTQLDSSMIEAMDSSLVAEDGRIIFNSSTAYDLLVCMATVLSQNNVPMLGRWAVVTPLMYSYLLRDDRFVGSGTEFNRAVLQNGQVGAAAGFTIYVSNNLNVDGGEEMAFAGTNAACSFAEQLVEMEALRSQTAFADVVRGLHVYGAKVLQPKALVVL